MQSWKAVMPLKYEAEERARMRRQAGNWNAMPIVLGIVFLFALGFLLISESTNPSSRSTSIEQSGR
jgi:hypothetical protein